MTRSSLGRSARRPFEFSKKGDSTVYWTVEVKEPGDIMLGIPPYVKRFAVETEGEAWEMYCEALRHGFESRAWQTRRMPR